MKTPMQLLFHRLETINNTMLDGDTNSIIAGILKTKDEWLEAEKNTIINAHHRGYTSDGSYAEAKKYYNENFNTKPR